MPMPVRRIVTHNNAQGRSQVLIDAIADNCTGTLTELWTTGSEPHDHDTTIDHGATSPSLLPPAGGTVFRYFEIPPESQSAHLSAEERAKNWADLFQRMNAPHIQPDISRDPGMHKSDTTDYIILLKGSITLVLDEGEVELKPLDVVVQRGTNHSWVNRGSENALLMGVLVDARTGA